MQSSTGEPLVAIPSGMMRARCVLGTFVGRRGRAGKK